MLIMPLLAQDPTTAQVFTLPTLSWQPQPMAILPSQIPHHPNSKVTTLSTPHPSILTLHFHNKVLIVMDRKTVITLSTTITLLRTCISSNSNSPLVSMSTIPPTPMCIPRQVLPILLIQMYLPTSIHHMVLT
uniref:Uncharacterized protein n=1 Tax=Cacopsylla melanoneura TaxID=428564 RepID=A0A8D8QSE3_9HEMI